MPNRFLTPIRIDAVSPFAEQIEFLNLLRQIDTALASTQGLHLADFTAEHGIPESDVLQNLMLLTQMGYQHGSVSRSQRDVLQYAPGQRRLFVAPPIQTAPPAAKSKSGPQSEQRLCEECGKPFTSRFSQTVTCSAACSFARGARNSRQKSSRRKEV